MRTIRAEDMHLRQGANGWPGCPDAYICTRYGVRTLAIGASGALHYVSNVFTSSDYQFHGRWEAGVVRLSGHYSCAHPQLRDRMKRAAPLVWSVSGDELRVAVEPGAPGDEWPFAERPTGMTWVFRRISRRLYYDRYLIRLCQPTDRHACAAGCTSMSLVEP